MRHLIFEEAASYPIALLAKTAAFRQSELIRHYQQPLEKLGLPAKDLIAFSLDYNQAGKAPAGFIKEYLANLLPGLDSLGVKTLYCADGNYFKVLTKQTKAEPHLGYVLPCAIKGYEHMQVVLGINYQVLVFNPDQQAKVDLSLETLAKHVQGTYQPLGEGIIHHAEYPQTVEEIRAALQKLHQYPWLSADIEAFSLNHWEAGIGTITFCWSQHEGLAFPVDYKPLAEPIWDNPNKQTTGIFGEQGHNPEVRVLLLEFLLTYKGTLRWHRASYDLKVLIYQLWMRHICDTEGLLEGLECLTRNFDDTLIITYLATNSCAGNELGLKPNAHEFAGNWANDEIKDIRRIPLPKLLQYNLVDGLSTNYVHAKHYPTMVADQQEEIYRTLMLPSLKVLIQTMLTGMPINPARVQKVRRILEAKEAELLKTITDNPLIEVLNLIVQTEAMHAANAKLKTKQHPLEKFKGITFNPNSGPQLQRLLYDQMGLPVLDKTFTGQPATGGDTLEKLIHHAHTPEHKAIIQALIDLAGVSKILSAFIPAFEKAVPIPGTDMALLFGNFNLGGTVSGRLSSSDPNLQNLPAGSEYGKLIKWCFHAMTGWLFTGADFNSLEDYISALTTKDPNKLAVYLQGYDGHCLRAFAYFKDELPGIVNTVESINSIKKKFEPVRQESKAPTFALTYQGTFRTLMKNLGWPEEKARRVEEGFKTLYRVSIEWVQKRLDQAAKDGYVTVAFGLRVRTPLLAQTYRGKSCTPKEAEAEGRTAGNAMGQSYGLLNSRAANEFMAKVWASPHRLNILPVAQIHDAQYYLIKNDLEVVSWANRELIQSMRWQELPEIQHDQVKLGAALDIYHPDWAHPVTLPNDTDSATILKLCKEHAAKLQEEAKEKTKAA